MSTFYRPDQRTEEDIEYIYEEMINIKAFSHFSQTVSNEVHTTCDMIIEFVCIYVHTVLVAGDYI